MEKKPIPNFPGWFATADGNIVDDKDDGPIKIIDCFHGYLQAVVAIYNPRRNKYLAIHLAVCSAFHGEYDITRWKAEHKNGNVKDNRAENLEWVQYVFGD